MLKKDDSTGLKRYSAAYRFGVVTESQQTNQVRNSSPNLCYRKSDSLALRFSNKLAILIVLQDFLLIVRGFLVVFFHALSEINRIKSN